MELCTYCGTPRTGLSCCGEVHFDESEDDVDSDKPPHPKERQMNKAESIDRELVLRVAGEPRAWAANEYIAAGNTFPFGFTVSTTQKYTNQQALYTEAQLLAVAEAMYTAGAEGMRERAVPVGYVLVPNKPTKEMETAGRVKAAMWQGRDVHTAIWYDMVAAAPAIRALPVTQANPEGEK